MITSKILNKSTVYHVFLFSEDNNLRAIENLMKKKGKFDYILLETTGLADPGKKCHYQSKT